MTAMGPCIHSYLPECGNFTEKNKLGFTNMFFRIQHFGG